MRLDLFLKASRLCLRRPVAQALCEAGAVTVNGTVARSSRDVHAGDILSIRRGERLTTVRVAAEPVSRQTSKSEAHKLYEMISDVTVPTVSDAAP